MDTPIWRPRASFWPYFHHFGPICAILALFALWRQMLTYSSQVMAIWKHARTPGEFCACYRKKFPTKLFDIYEMLEKALIRSDREKNYTNSKFWWTFYWTEIIQIVLAKIRIHKKAENMRHNLAVCQMAIHDSNIKQILDVDCFDNWVEHFEFDFGASLLRPVDVFGWLRQLLSKDFRIKILN